MKKINLKDVPADNVGLGKLPTEVRNKMGYKKMGGEKLLNKMQMGGTMDMSDNFVEKMRGGGMVKKMKYKEPIMKKQIGGSMQSRINSFKSRRQ
jgi:hypothetical protein